MEWCLVLHIPSPLQIAQVRGGSGRGSKFEDRFSLFRVNDEQGPCEDQVLPSLVELHNYYLSYVCQYKLFIPMKIPDNNS